MSHLRIVPLSVINGDAAERVRQNVVSIQKRAATTKRIADQLQPKVKQKGCPNAFAAFVLGVTVGFVCTAFLVAGLMNRSGGFPQVMPTLRGQR